MNHRAVHVRMTPQLIAGQLSSSFCFVPAVQLIVSTPYCLPTALPHPLLPPGEVYDDASLLGEYDESEGRSAPQ